MLEFTILKEEHLCNQFLWHHFMQNVCVMKHMSVDNILMDGFVNDELLKDF
jgi:hypothetical protein